MKRSEKVDIVDWKDYIDEEILNQLEKQPLFPLDVPNSLKYYWPYHYSIAWFYLVCSSYWTSEEVKPMWAHIKFDEKLLLLSLNENEEFEDTKEQEFQEGNIYGILRLQLLKTLSQNKQAKLKDWDSTMKIYLENIPNLEFYTKDEDILFMELSPVDQFSVIYGIIKIIERKLIVFKNYLLNYTQIFQFPEIRLNDSESLIVLPGSRVINKVILNNKNNLLHIPIKLKNCSIRYENEQSVELIRYDYTKEIESYISGIKINLSPQTYGWNSFLEFINNVKSSNVREFFLEIVGFHAANELYGFKLYNNMIKEKSMQELLVRRKRSSRLVAKEEGIQKRKLEMLWYEKLDNRDQFNRDRNKLVTKRCKKIKDSIWSILWDRFDHDLKIEKIKRRNLDNINTINEYDYNQENILTGLDRFVLDNSESFKDSIIKIQYFKPLEFYTLELPEKLCITENDMTILSDLGISQELYTVDSKDWWFQCPCGIIEGPNLQDHVSIIGHNLICCDKCLRWQHWNCQPETVINILSQGYNKTLTIKDFDVVLIGQTHQRRGYRRGNTTQYTEIDNLYERPTNKRKKLSETELFICGWCILEFEEELRKMFIPELIAIRTKQKKQSEEREKRKNAKEKKNLQIQSQLYESQLDQPHESQNNVILHSDTHQLQETIDIYPHTKELSMHLESIQSFCLPGQEQAQTPSLDST